MSACRLALLSVLLGMAVATAPTEAVGQEEPQGQAVDVVVENRTGSKAHVYMLQRGHMVHLGLVPEIATATLSLPPFFVETEAPIQLVVDPLGSTDWFKSDSVTPRPANDIELTLESDLAASSISVTG